MLIPDPMSTSRRNFLKTGLAAGALMAAGPLKYSGALASGVDDIVLETVTGPVMGSTIKKALAHEHFYADFHGPSDANYMNVDWQAVTGASVTMAEELAAQDVNLFIDWTNIGIGRNVMMLRHVARQTGVNIVSSTGIYKGLVPPALADLPVNGIADHFIRELTMGIDGTAIRAGWIKISTTETGTTEQESDFHRAAAIAANETGCTITLHSPQAPTAWSVVSVLQSEGFKLDRFVWGHAQPSASDEHLKMVDEGAMVQFDAISANSDPFFNGPTDDESMLDRIESVVKAGHSDRVLVSADAAAYIHPPAWQYDRDNGYVYRYFEAKLATRLGEEITNRILRDNVISAFRRGDHVV